MGIVAKDISYELEQNHQPYISVRIKHSFLLPQNIVYEAMVTKRGKFMRRILSKGKQLEYISERISCLIEPTTMSECTQLRETKLVFSSFVELEVITQLHITNQNIIKVRKQIVFAIK